MSATTLDVSEMAGGMFNAFSEVLKDKGPEVVEYAKVEAAKLAETLALIGRQRASGLMTPRQAQFHLDMQKDAAIAVFLTIEGLSILLAQQAMEAAFNVVRKAVNTIVGFGLV